MRALDRPAFVPSAKAIRWAKDEEARGDAIKTNGFRNFSDRRWLGFLGEWYFARWLRSKGVAFKRYGGSDTTIDFVVSGVDVGVKCCGANGSFTERHVVNVYDCHRESSPKVLSFVGHVGLDNPESIVMLGSMTKDDYFKRATFIPAGGMLNPVTVAENDVWNLAIGDLHPPKP